MNAKEFVDKHLDPVMLAAHDANLKVVAFVVEIDPDAPEGEFDVACLESVSQCSEGEEFPLLNLVQVSAKRWADAHKPK